MLIKQTLFIEFYYYSPPANRAVTPREANPKAFGERRGVSSVSSCPLGKSKPGRQ
jgi:hypothetical protein